MNKCKLLTITVNGYVFDFNDVTCVIKGNDPIYASVRGSSRFENKFPVFKVHGVTSMVAESISVLIKNNEDLDIIRKNFSVTEAMERRSNGTFCLFSYKSLDTDDIIYTVRRCLVYIESTEKYRYLVFKFCSINSCDKSTIKSMLYDTLEDNTSCLMSSKE